MSKFVTRTIPTITVILFLSACAHIKPTNTSGKNEFSSPSANIRDFKKDTQELELDQVIKNEQIIEKDVVFVKNMQSNKKVKFWINYFNKKGRYGFQRFIDNGERYRPIVESIFEQYGLPKDLYYVGVIESGYQNRARSHAGAVGPWQFIKGTAKRYGLKVTSSIDERKNIYKSTQAAALYFQDLYNIFGSWELALAAYNAGEYGVIRRIRGANTRDYYELSKRKILPKETRHYVPKLIAAMTVIKNAQKYSFKARKSYQNKYTRTKAVNIKSSMSLSKLSKKLRVSARKIKELNHDIMKNYIPYLGRKGFDVYIPSSHVKYVSELVVEKPKVKKRAKRSLATKKRQRTKGPSNYHVVRKNESLFSISKRYNITLKTLKRINTLKSTTIYVGQKIKLLGSQNTKVVYSYTVRKGDNLTFVASKFDSNIREIKRLNNLRAPKIFIGQKLKVPPHKKKIYTVKSGDALGAIARRNKITLKKIKMINKISENTIYPGQKIIISLSRI